ncbi:radical SAM/SPASM domain-containing protein [Pelotomaculum propionicicum]|uniref:Anaerobic sulfatase-maturating enzyme n=1 Tax=Pelotomaculum propionicicum TaxID=258475 RepID=A0A4Y7RN47_9FIRM|nr:radical SAM protein [Pelotomaculum propionicicum]TEB10405.1 Anaerobic sulfatase-maturating enzyme [Pelotomaculum propionicicum]
MTDKKRPLRMLSLSLTGRCNFACRYCYAQAHPQDMMSLDTAMRAVNLAAGGGEPFVLQFSGGEPLLAFDLLREVVRYVRRRQIPAVMQLQTNASLLDREMVLYLREARVGVGISLDGRPGANDCLRRFPDGRGTSAQILRGAGHLAAQGMETGITCVVANENVNQLAGVVEMAYYLGNVRRIGFDLLRGQGRGRMLTPPPAQAVAQGLLEALQTAERLAGQTGRTMLISQLERVETLSRGTARGFGHCHAMNAEAAFVDAKGGIYACSSLVGDEDFRLGDAAHGIDEGRRQAVAALIRNSMIFCRECPAFPLCGGGCFARWYGSGCAGKAYEAECALKQVCIQWYQEHRKQEEK